MRPTFSGIHGACARVYTNIANNEQSIARHYMLNMDWLRLYNSNPGVANPDELLENEAIQVGPVYSVAPGDTLLSIAGIYLPVVGWVGGGYYNWP
jgi:hypothetical protein